MGARGKGRQSLVPASARNDTEREERSDSNIERSSVQRDPCSWM
jgi:hypothetical protein